MGSRSFAQVDPTSATVALNASIFGFAEPSIVTPHAPLKQLWWTDERIKAKVTENFIVSKLQGQERVFLSQLPFGESLTDHTYLEYILEKAKRLFLILTEVGVPDQIFGCIANSWDDEALPLELEEVRMLELSYENDETLNQKFFDLQFAYLLRELQQGSHIDYNPKEHIPMEHVNSLPPAVSLQTWNRIHFPGKPNDIFMRRRFSLTDKETTIDDHAIFREEVDRAELFAHEHIVPVWASYSIKNAGYVLSDFVGEHTLASFISHRNPVQLQRVPETKRPNLLCEWMHCLADALASLHHRGSPHTAVRPSNILIDRSNHIAFADVGCLRIFQRGKKIDATEVYNYSAPESQVSLPLSPSVGSPSAFARFRKITTSPSSDSTTTAGEDSTSSHSIGTDATNMTSTSATGNAVNSAMATPSVISTASKSNSIIGHLGIRVSRFSSAKKHAFQPPSTPTIRNLPIRPIPASDLFEDLPVATPEMSDIFSLACVFLDILTFTIQSKTTEFVKFRTTRVRSLVSSSKRSRTDTAFHTDSSKIRSWMTRLESESAKFDGRIFRGVPDMLRLVDQMMNQNATLRPTALQVRDRLQHIFRHKCGIEALCCDDRPWNISQTPRSYSNDSAYNTKESFTAPDRIANERPSGRSIADNPPGSPDDTTTMLPLSASSKAFSTRSERSSGSAATAKISSWEKPFMRRD